MGCASSSSAACVDEQVSTASKWQERAHSKDPVAEVNSAAETAFASELTKLVDEATSSAKPKDAWVVLYKCADLICSAFGIKTCSIVIYTSSGLGCKLACNAGSVLNELVLQHPDLLPAEALGFITGATTSQKPVCVKLADFGLSELRSSDGQVVGDLGGTVTHVAPESVLHRQISGASDVYAFGVLMWELYTGQQPYRALLSHISRREDRHRALLARVVREGLRPSFPPGVPQDYWSLAVQCWGPDPTTRPTTGEVLAALEVMYGKYAGPPTTTTAAAGAMTPGAQGGGGGGGGGAGGGMSSDPLTTPA